MKIKFTTKSLPLFFLKKQSIIQINNIPVLLSLRLKRLMIIIFVTTITNFNYSQPLSKDTLVFGSDKFYPPYEFLNENGEPEGFNIDLIHELAREMGVVIKIKLGNWEQIRKELEYYGTVHISDMFYSVTRDSIVDFAVPHEVMYDEIILHKDSKFVFKIEDLKGKTVAVQKASSLEDYLRLSYPGISIITTATEFDALKLVSEKKYYAAIVSQATGQEAIKKHDIKNLVSYGRLVLPREYCFVVKEGNQQLLRNINTAMIKLISEGKIEKIREKWFGEKIFGITTMYFVIGFFIVIFFLFLIFFWNHALLKRIKNKTAQLFSSEAKYKAMIEAIPDLIFLCDKHGILLDYNTPEGEKSLVVPDRILGMKFSEVLPSPIVEDLNLSFQKCLTTGEKQQVDYQLEFNGIIRSYEAFLTRCEEDKILTLARDITERKEAENKIESQLKELKQWYNVTVGRENRVIELKKEVNNLLRQLGKTGKYDSVNIHDKEN